MKSLKIVCLPLIFVKHGAMPSSEKVHTKNPMKENDLWHNKA